MRLTEPGFLETQRQEEEPLNFTAIDTRKEQCYLFSSVVDLLEILFYLFPSEFHFSSIYFSWTILWTAITRTIHTREVTAGKGLLAIVLLTFTSMQLEPIHKQAERCEFVRFCLFFPL